MPNVYGDQRECMKQIDQMMAEQQARRFTPKIPGEVQFIRMWLFSHFDSRGGSFVLKAIHVIDALKAYIEKVYAGDPNDPYMVNSAYEDLVGLNEFIILGEPINLNEAQELYMSYRPKGEGGYRSLQVHTLGYDGTWMENNTIVLATLDAILDLSAKHNAPDLNGLTKEKIEEDFILEDWEETHDEPFTIQISSNLKLIDRNLGEDACGLYYFK